MKGSVPEFKCSERERGSHPNGAGPGRSRPAPPPISLDTIRQLYDYSYWARDRQIACCAELTDYQFLTPVRGSFRSLKATLAHLVLAEWIWSERLEGRNPESVPLWAGKIATFSNLCQRWKLAEKVMLGVISKLRERDLTEPLTYWTLERRRRSFLLWEILLHLVNHQSYHRGQITAILRQLGKTPPSVDFIEYLEATDDR